MCCCCSVCGCSVWELSGGRSPSRVAAARALLREAGYSFNCAVVKPSSFLPMASGGGRTCVVQFSRQRASRVPQWQCSKVVGLGLTAPKLPWWMVKKPTSGNCATMCMKASFQMEGASGCFKVEGSAGCSMMPGRQLSHMYRKSSKTKVSKELPMYVCIASRSNKLAYPQGSEALRKGLGPHPSLLHRSLATLKDSQGGPARNAVKLPR